MICSLYLAGPDVFRPDARAHGAELKALCARFGIEGLYPLDQDVPATLLDPGEQARWIYRANIGLIERADAVLANLDFFRGPEPDSGTCFEVGYAVARGKPVYGYISEGGTLAQRIRQRHPQAVGPDGVLDAHGWSIEEFGLPLNLMLSVPAPLVVGDAAMALAQLARQGETPRMPVGASRVPGRQGEVAGAA
ncbi:nucleoside 2-deoxyribosyltransferase [Luteimonas sp. TWI662]|uniref:nucleoside 2-deoxyribosyltransferase n=1 Tax=Luteimonas sp. TWI662 TaxID=3136789 RepID=UPI003207F9C2